MKDTDHYYAALGLRPGSSLEEVHRAYRRLSERWEKTRTGDDPLLRRVQEERLDTVEKSYRALVSYLEQPDVVSAIPSEDGQRIGAPVDSSAESVDTLEEPKKEFSPPDVRFEATSMPKRPSVLFLMVLGLVALVLYGVAYHSLAGFLAEHLGWSRGRIEFGMYALVPLFLVLFIQIYRRSRRP
jgi:hypothetical protein